MVGSTLRLGRGAPDRTVTVVGLHEIGARGRRGQPDLRRGGSLARWHAAAPEREIVVRARPASAQTTLARRSAARRPVPTRVDDRQSPHGGGQPPQQPGRRMGRFLQGFAVIALLVAGLVIANTFRIVMAQRVREIALLRCVGAETVAGVRDDGGRGALARCACRSCGYGVRDRPCRPYSSRCWATRPLRCRCPSSPLLSKRSCCRLPAELP